MKKDNFDELSEKIITLLDHEYKTLNEGVDPFEDKKEINPDDPKQNMIDHLRVSLDQATREKQAANELKKKIADDVVKKTVIDDHARKVVKEKDKEQQIRKLKLIQNADLDIFIDDEMISLAEEFEMDLNEGDDMENGITKQTMALNDVRSDLQGELTAIKDYDTHADQLEKAGMKDAAEILRDIRDEEKVHVGELQKVMDKYDKEYEKSVEDGKKEASQELKEAILAMRLREETINKLAKEQKTIDREANKVGKINDKALLKITDIENKIQKLKDENPDWENENNKKMEIVRKKIAILLAKKEDAVDKKQAINKAAEDVDKKQAEIEFKKKRKDSYDVVFNEEQQQTTEIPEFATKQYDDPMLNKISQQIRVEYEKDIVDMKKIKELTMKFNRYKG